MDILSSNSLLLMEKSMGFLWTKQAAILDNIANAETPNYQAKNVVFEEKLRAKLELAGRSPKAHQSVRSIIQNTDFAVYEPGEVTRMDDNGVNVTEQSVEMIRNAYQLQYIMQSISTDLSTLRKAITGQ